MSTYVIGINGGATHTQFTLIDEQVNELARISAGASNFRNVGFEAARDTLIQGIRNVTSQAHLTTDQLVGIGVGLAGVDHPAERAMFQEALESAFSGVRATVEN